ncbi:MAG: carboxypeptidase-like regulatory domain-containing protein, partial [Nitrososphaera sp.]
MQKKYEEVVSKVDPKLINDLLLRQMENPGSAPVYMVETFLEPSRDIQKVRETILQETGMAPAIYDNGTHIAVRQPLTLDMLERISNREEVTEVTGEYDTGTWADSHEHNSSRRHEAAARIKKSPASSIVSNSSSSPQSVLLAETKEPIKTNGTQQQSRKERSKSKFMIAAYTAVGISGAIALAGFIISGGMLPNSNSRIQSSFSTTTTGSLIGNEPGATHGYVEGLSGLPFIGASVIAENIETGQTTSTFVSLTGDYLINLPPGTYQITVSFQNGTTQVVDNYEITRGTA